MAWVSPKSRCCPFCWALGGSLPLSIPPLPEDQGPGQRRAEECLFYLQCNGLGRSRRQEQQPRRAADGRAGSPPFYQTVWSKINEACRRDAFDMGESDAKLFAENVLPLIEIGPHAAQLPIFVSEVTIAPGGTMPDIRGGAIVFTGPRHRADQENPGPDGGNVRGRNRGVDRSDDRRRGDERAPPAARRTQIVWGFAGEYLVIGVGEGSAGTDVKAMKKPAAPPAG